MPQKASARTVDQRTPTNVRSPSMSCSAKDVVPKLNTSKDSRATIRMAPKIAPRRSAVFLRKGRIWKFRERFIRFSFCEPEANEIDLLIIEHRSEERRVGKECRSRWSQ